MKIRIICVGKLKEQYLKDMQNEYLKRLSKYSKVEIIELNDKSIINNPSEKEEEKVKELETAEILNKIDKNSYNIVLDVSSKEIDSVEFSTRIKSYQEKSVNYINFIIGGSLGFSKNIDCIANEKISLSRLTFTHQFARIILLEQVYRSFKILNNETYHK